MKSYNKHNILELSWTTKKEKEEILKLGSSHAEVKKRTSHRTLLIKYLEAAEKRVNWADLIKTEIIRFVNEQIAKCPS